MSPDPLISSAHLASPETWNRYVYALNNPLSITDPTGLFNWDETAGGDISDADLEIEATNKDVSKAQRNKAKNALKFRAKFRAALAAADAAAQSGSLTGDQQAAVAQAVGAYGTENDNNGVTVGWHKGGDDTTTPHHEGLESDVSFTDAESGDNLSAAIAHEGVHINDYYEEGMGWASITHHDSEQMAFAVGGFAAQALGVKAYPPGYMGYDTNHQAWNKGWRASEIERNRARGIRNILRDYYPDSGRLLYPDSR